MESTGKKNTYTGLTHDELMDLCRRSAGGDLDARETLILSHLPLVKGLVTKFLGKGVDYDDLYQEGCCGLIEAIGRFDPTRGAELGTYAYYWINKRLHKALHTQSVLFPMKISERDFYSLCRLIGTYHEMYTASGRPPTQTELAKELGITDERTRETLSRLYTFSSLNENTPAKTNQAEHILSAEDTYLQESDPLDNLDIRSTLLTERERTVLQMYLGLPPYDKPYSFKAISAKLFWSEATIMAAYARAISKLRNAIPPEGM